MTPPADPYRVLGLAPGAPLVEVKRAYRRLAKESHPDASGKGATARFIALQQAYEAIVRDGQHGRRPAATPPAATRARPAPGQRPTPGGRPSSGGRADERAGGSPGAERGPSAGREERRSGDRPGGPAGARDGGARQRRDGTPPGGRGTRPGGARRRSAEGGERASAPRAGLGTTSYDGADAERPSSWHGASWYGVSMGTYWTVNPKEYADPRKHGPEYLARGRRLVRAARTPAGGGAGAGSDPGAGPGASNGDAPEPSRSGGAAATGTNGRRREPERAGGAPRAETAAGAARGATETAAGAAREATETAAGAARQATEAARPVAEVRPAPTARPAPSSRPAAAGGLPLPTRRRLGVALLAWPPLGAAAGALIAAATGCEGYAATCPAPLDLIPLAVQPMILALLIAAPRLARPASVGTVALAVAALPATALLSAAGGFQRPGEIAATLLMLALALAWVVGTAGAAAGRFRLPSEPLPRG